MKLDEKTRTRISEDVVDKVTDWFYDNLGGDAVEIDVDAVYEHVGDQIGNAIDHELGLLDLDTDDFKETDDED